MGVLNINSDNSTLFADAMVFRSSNERQFKDWSQSGVAAPNVEGLNDTWDKVQQPWSTTGFTVDVTGAYLFHEGVEGESVGAANAVQSIMLRNDGINNVYVGVNIPTSGGWSIGEGYLLPPTSGVTFGGPDHGGQIIRNAWAIAVSTGFEGLVAGYASNQRTGV